MGMGSILKPKGPYVGDEASASHFGFYKGVKANQTAPCQMSSFAIALMGTFDPDSRDAIMDVMHSTCLSRSWRSQQPLKRSNEQS